MHSFINCADILVDSACQARLQHLYNLYIQHKFNLLGSGWVKVNYELCPMGVHGRKYQVPFMEQFGRKIKRKLKKARKCTEGYEPVNWFVDYKSGFFFHPEKYKTIQQCRSVIGKKPGVDIKCPWELGRFYHLVQLAVYAVAEESVREKVIIEFKNEIMDFIELNPIGQTVQWSAPMDTSIRIVNLLISYDVILQMDVSGYLDDDFQKTFEQHIYNSLKFVMEHLEYHGRIGSNHYLSDLAGVIFAAAYLTADEWTDACLVFGVQELIEQVRGQFYEEGSNFEGSTSYHRLSTECVLYSTALIYGVLKTQRKKIFGSEIVADIKRLRSIKRQKYNVKNQKFFPSWYIDRLCNAGIFTKSILKDNNEIVQIGDNDSGRLIKLTPMYEPAEEEITDNVIDHRTLLSAINGLFFNSEFAKYAEELPLESSIVKSMSGRQNVFGNIYSTLVTEYGNDENINRNYQYKKETVIYKDEGDKSLLSGACLNYFKGFGIVIIRSDRMFLSMVIDTAKNAIHVGHTHNDKLSVELTIDNQYITRDPGGYVYTALPEVRDRFRSVMAHNTIHIRGKEQNAFEGIFGMQKKAKVQLLYCCNHNVIARARYDDIEHLREIKIVDNQILIIDYSNHPFTVAFKNRLYSTGYGELIGRLGK